MAEFVITLQDAVDQSAVVELQIGNYIKGDAGDLSPEGMAASAAAIGAASAAAASAATAANAAAYELQTWGNAEAFDQFDMLTEDANGVTLTANIKWPDGTSGVFTADTVNSTFSAIDAWHATYLGATTKTVTQPLVTRRATDGKVTNKPRVTIS